MAWKMKHFITKEQLCRTYFAAKEDFDSAYFRIPFCEITNNDVLIVGGDVRYDGVSDMGNIDVGIARSLDHGRTFVDKQIVLKNHREVENSRIIDACILIDRMTNRVFLFGHCINSNEFWERVSTPGQIEAYMVYKYSDDEGLTWSEEISLEHLKDDSMVSLFPAPGKGITMSNGILVVPCQIRTDEKEGRPSIQSCIIISKDHSKTWEFKGGRVEGFSSECQVVELDNGELMLNCRSYASYRCVYLSKDLGQTWGAHSTNCNTLVEPYACQASLDKTHINEESVYVFCNPNSLQERDHITLKISQDTVNWQEARLLVEERTDGYSCICSKKDTLYIAVERTGDIQVHVISIQ